ncbi:hypothetical protein D9M69_661020 [compost metagenome]
MLANEDPVKKIEIIPNPVSEVLTLKIPEGETLESVEIIDSAGGGRLTSKTLNTRVTHLPSGTYLLKVKTDRDTYSAKMMKL